MSPVLAVARREIAERRFLIWTGVLLGALPVVLHAIENVWNPGEVGASGMSMVELAGLTVGLTYPPAVALAVGASIVGRDLAEGRLRFYFARPLSAFALWAGKFLGAAVLVFLGLASTYGVVLVTLVGWRFFGEGERSHWERKTFAFVFLCALLFMAVSHVVTTLYRSRSRWLALDLLAGTAVLGTLGWQIRDLLLRGAGRTIADEMGSNEPRGLPVLVFAPLVVMLGAALAQLAVGRADPRRGHVAFSAALWSLSLVPIGGLWLFGLWLGTAGPANLGAGSFVYAAPRGSGLLFSSARDRKGFDPSFLMDGASGGWTQVSRERVSTPAFDGDGQRAVWVGMGRETTWMPQSPAGHALPLLAVWSESGWMYPGMAGGALFRARFDGGAPRVDEVPLDPGDGWKDALATTADRAVLRTKGRVGLVDVGSGRVLQVLDAAAAAADFRAEGVRLYAWEGDRRGALVVLDWDPATGVRTERLRVAGEGGILGVHRVGDVALAWIGAQRVILDVARGTSHAVPGDFSGCVLEDGRVAVGVAEGVRVVSSAGETLATTAFPGRVDDMLVEYERGRLAVGRFDLHATGFVRTLFVDAGSGAILREEQDLVPAAHRALLPRAGSPGAHLFRDRAGSLLRLDADGTRRVVVAAVE